MKYQIFNIILIGFGGMLGTICRYLIGIYSSQQIATILFINIFGSFVAGFFQYFLTNPLLKNLLLIGFCGGFTTFSTFAIQQYQLINDHQWFNSLSTIAMSIFGSIFAVYSGHKTQIFLTNLFY